MTEVDHLNNMQTPESSIMAALATLKPPPDKNIWIGPFDQLVSSGNTLLIAAQKGFESRNVADYHSRVLSRVVTLLQMDPNCKDPALNDYLLGFYFNAGFQRFIWGAERLLTTFAAVKCTCVLGEPAISRGKHGRWPRVKDVVIPKAEQRLQHKHFDSQLISFRTIVSHMKAQNTYKCEPDNATPIFRDEVDLRKHSVYDANTLGRSRPIRADGTVWEPPDQMRLAVDAYKLTCSAYGELRTWNLAAALV